MGVIRCGDNLEILALFERALRHIFERFDAWQCFVILCKANFMQTYLRYPHRQWQFCGEHAISDLSDPSYLHLRLFSPCSSHGYRISSIAIHEHVDRERSLAFSEKHPSIQVSRIA